MRFGILGTLRVGTEADAVTVTAARERTVLALLLLHANQVVPAARLVEAVWSARLPRDARNQLQGCVSRLRRRLAAAGAGQLLHTDPIGYRLQIDPTDLDLLAFRQLRAQARAAVAEGREADAQRGYRAALGLWRGPALAGIDSALVRRLATGLDEERVQALEECLRVELTLGRDGELVSELTELLTQHPYRETLHGVLMLALYRAGRPADALAAYRALRQRLHDDLGTEPGAELRQLHQAILNHDPALTAHQRVIPAPDRPPGRPVPRELPGDVVAFTGRASALAALGNLLAEQATGHATPVTISVVSGTAGVGKTALVIHWAHQVADRFPDGQLYVDLRGFAPAPPMRPIEALTALLRSLGTDPDRIPTDEARAAAMYRSTLAGRRVLVVLDNAQSVAQVRPLLPGSPGCLVVVTSREQLTGLVVRDGARRLTLNVLTAAEAGDLLRTLLGQELVSREPAAAAGALAEACAYLPLALRIAAASIAEPPGRTITDYVDRLRTGDRLRVLRTDDDEASSVPAALDFSYRSLPAAAARLFRLLGLVPGPDFTAAAAAALAGTSVVEATELLHRLNSAHLVQGGSPGRFRFHDLLRLHAQQLAGNLDRERDRTAALSRLFDYYLHGADAAARSMYAEMLRLPIPARDGCEPWPEFSQPSEAHQWLDAEHANLLAAITYAAEHGPPPVAWLLADCLRGYYWRNRRLVDWATAASAAHATAGRERDRWAQIAAERGLADLCLNQDRLPAAIEHYTRAADLARQSDWHDAEAAVLTNLGILYQNSYQLPMAAWQYARARELDRRNARPEGEAVSTNNLAKVDHELGRLADALASLEHALSLHRQLGSVAGEADTLSNLGEVTHELGQFGEAMAHLTRARELHESVGATSGIANDLAGLAAVHRDAGRLQPALELADQAVRLADQAGAPRLAARARTGYGSVLFELGRYDEALASHRQALAAGQAAKARLAEAYARLGLAGTQLRLDSPDQAHRHATAALEIAQQTGYQVIEGRALTVLAEILFRQQQYEQAREYAEAALRRHQQTGHRLGEARTHVVLGQLRCAVGDSTAAKEHWRVATEQFVELSAPMPEQLQAGTDC